jgi:hypothetical protein
MYWLQNWTPAEIFSLPAAVPKDLKPQAKDFSGGTYTSVCPHSGNSVKNRDWKPKKGDSTGMQTPSAH